jgi:hypothetical protein
VITFVIRRVDIKGFVMAYGVVHKFAGGTQAQYETTLATVHPADGSLPKGQLSHFAGPSAAGWTIVAIHDSQESWETFRDQVLVPRLAEGIEGGLEGPPEETTFEVANEATA